MLLCVFNKQCDVFVQLEIEKFRNALCVAQVTKADERRRKSRRLFRFFVYSIAIFSILKSIMIIRIPESRFRIQSFKLFNCLELRCVTHLDKKNLYFERTLRLTDSQQSRHEGTEARAQQKNEFLKVLNISKRNTKSRC